MLNFHRINDISDPLFTKLYDLYTSAFPPTERRTWDGLVREIDTENNFHPHALLKRDEFVGFFNYWTFEKFCYLEHIAVNSKIRNQHIGSEAMEIFMDQVKLPIVFEVEMPNTLVASRRIHFYERLGFSVVSHTYAQPPYDKESSFFLPVLLMSNNVHYVNTHFEMIKDTLNKKVYHYDDYSETIETIDETIND